jgi:hypothetical protein
MIKHTLFPFFICSFLFTASGVFGQPTLTVPAAVTQLDYLLSLQTPPALLIPQSEEQSFEVYFIENRFGPGVEKEKPANAIKELKSQRTHAFQLSGTGIYIISSILGIGTERLKLVWGTDSIALPAAPELIIEISGFGLRYYPSGAEHRAAVKIREESTSILALLAISSGIVREDKIPLGTSQWITIAQELEQNAFLQNQLGSLRLSLLPADYPLMDQVVTLLIEKSREYFRQFPSLSPMESAMLRSTIQDNYFSVQDMEKQYRQPILADGTAELRSAEERILKRRREEGLNATAIAAGLTDFVIERAKEEFSITFLENMQRDVSTGGRNKLRELCLLFPQTCSFFTSQADLRTYKSILPMAREVFIHDLRDIGLNIHRLLELDPYKRLKNSGQIYNLALFYDIASMAYQGVSMDTVLNNISVRLERREKDLYREQNREIAEKALKTDLQDLQSEVTLLTKQLDMLSKKIILKGFDLELAFNTFKNQAEKANENTLFQKMYKEYLQETSTRDDYLFLWTSRDQHSQLRNIPRNLEGRRYYERLMAAPRLAQYKSHFSSNPDSIQLIASGIELSKNLVRPSGELNHLPTFMTEYYRFLLDYEKKLALASQQLKANSEEGLKLRNDILNKDIDALREILEAEIIFWTKLQLPLTEDDIFGLSYLKGALDPKIDPRWKISNSLPIRELKETIEVNEERLKQALAWSAERMEILQQKTAIKSPQLPKISTWLSPALPASKPEETENAPLDSILAQSSLIANILDRLDITYTPSINTAYRQTLLMKEITGMSSILSACLQSNNRITNGNPYLKPSDFYEIMRQNRSRDLFLGITQQQLLQVQLSGPLSTRSVASVTTKFVDIVYRAGVLRDSLDFARSQDRKLQFTDYFPLVRSTMDLLGTLIDNRLNEGDSQFSLLRNVPLITDQTLSMFENVQAERYGSALFNLVELFTLVSAGSDSASLRWNALRSDLIRYGSFMANVASAQTADEVKSALLAVALPPGSSRVKREDVFNVALNAYLGLSAGRETLNAPGIQNPRAASIGLGLPVGISTSWKFKQEHKMSYSALFSILDLGAIAAFRLGDNAAEDLPELKFENLVAPGGFLLANFPKSPFSLGFGGQYGPRARKITFNGIESRSSAWRWLLFAGIDVPIFNFVTKRGQ